MLLWHSTVVPLQGGRRLLISRAIDTTILVLSFLARWPITQSEGWHIGVKLGDRLKFLGAFLSLVRGNRLSQGKDPVL